MPSWRWQSCPADKKAAYEAEVERYKQEKKEIQARAEALEAEAKKFNELSEHSLHPHHRLAQATTLVQIAISIAAITVLTRKLWLFWASGLAAALGVVLWVMAWLGDVTPTVTPRKRYAGEPYSLSASSATAASGEAD